MNEQMNSIVLRKKCYTSLLAAHILQRMRAIASIAFGVVTRAENVTGASWKVTDLQSIWN